MCDVIVDLENESPNQPFRCDFIVLDRIAGMPLISYCKLVFSKQFTRETYACHSSWLRGQRTVTGHRP